MNPTVVAIHAMKSERKNILTSFHMEDASAANAIV
jgi:hypothetical protein